MTDTRPLIERLAPDDAERLRALIDERDSWRKEVLELRARVAELEAEREEDMRAAAALNDALKAGGRGWGEADALIALFADRIAALGQQDDVADGSDTTAECGDIYGRPDDDPLVCTLDQSHVGTHCGQGAE